MFELGELILTLIGSGGVIVLALVLIGMCVIGDSYK
jgi:hypothetical protein